MAIYINLTVTLLDLEIESEGGYKLIIV